LNLFGRAAADEDDGGGRPLLSRHQGAITWSSLKPSAMQVTTIGPDIAKRVFQVHGVDSEGAIVIRRKLKRSELLHFFNRLAPCLVGIEACATANYRARSWRLATRSG